MLRVAVVAVAGTRRARTAARRGPAARGVDIEFQRFPSPSTHRTSILTDRASRSARWVVALILAFGLALSAVGEAKGEKGSSKGRSARSGGGTRTARAPASRPSASKPIHVRSYVTKSGTVVAAHSRALPSTRTTPAVTKGTRATTRSSPKRTAAVKTTAAPKTSTTRKKSAAATTQPRDAKGRFVRSAEAKRAFERQTGYPHGRGGYVVDHIVPLACGGADAPSNMQWQTVAAAKAKDRVERNGCR